MAQKLLALIVLLCICLPFCIIMPQNYVAFASGILSDEDFFGFCNNLFKEWYIEPSINYEHNPNDDELKSILKQAESEAKRANYSSAKEILYTYFKNKKEKLGINFAGLKYQKGLDTLILDNIFTGSGYDYLAGTISLTDEFSQHSLDVTDEIIKHADFGAISFMLFARERDNLTGEFFSKESENAPKILISTDLGDFVIYADKDTCISAGNNAKLNFGTQHKILVRESGNNISQPFDEKTFRGYINFNLSEVPKNTKINSAILFLNGRFVPDFEGLDAGKKDVHIFVTGDTTWDEENLNWDGVIGNVYSWQGFPDIYWSNLEGSDLDFGNFISCFSFAESLIYAWQYTNDEVYVNKLIRLLESFMKNDTQSLNVKVKGERLSNFVTIFNFLLDYENMNPVFLMDFLKFMIKEAREIASNIDVDFPDKTWKLYEAWGLYKFCAYFPEFVNSNAWFLDCKSKIEGYSRTLLNDDFSFFESSTSYLYESLCLFVKIKEFSDIFGIGLSGGFYENVKKMAHFFVNLTFPNGYAIGLGEAGYKDAGDFLEKFCDVFCDDYLKFIITGGKEGVEPDYYSIFYPDAKLAVMRDGFLKDSLYLAFQNYMPSYRMQNDLLSINSYAYNTPLLVDNGRFYNFINEKNEWLKSGDAHNIVSVEDLSLDLNTNNKSFDFWDNEFMDMAISSHDGYKDVIYTRAVSFIKEEGFWIVSDLLESQNVNTYNQNWHFLPRSTLEVDSESKTAKVTVQNKANLTLVPLDEPLALVKDGYFSKDGGYLVKTKYLAYQKCSDTANFDTLLFPSKLGGSIEITAQRVDLDVPGTVAGGIKINLPQKTGYYYISHEDEPKMRDFSGYQIHAKSSYISEIGESLEYYSLFGAFYLGKEGTRLIESPKLIENISVKTCGDSLYIYSSSKNIVESDNEHEAIAIYAPDAGKVYFNGEEKPNFKKVGDYIYVVKSTCDDGSIKPNSPFREYSSKIFTPKALPRRLFGKNQIIEFDLTPVDDKILGTISFGAGDNLDLQNAKMGLRLSFSGYFEVCNKNKYEAAYYLPYRKNTKYHVKIVFDMEDKKYSVYVTENQNTYCIAKDFEFNENSAARDYINKYILKSDSSGDFYIENLESYNDPPAAEFSYIDINSNEDEYLLNIGINPNNTKVTLAVSYYDFYGRFLGVKTYKANENETEFTIGFLKKDIVYPYFMIYMFEGELASLRPARMKKIICAY